MTTSTALDKQVTEEQERHDLLEQLTAQGVTIDPETSLQGLQEAWATFGPDAKAKNAKVERKRENEETTPPARELETDAEEGEEETAAEPATKPDPEGKALFDKDAYIPEALALPMIDGEGIDKIGAKFGGSFLMERGDERDVALVRDLKLGQTVTLLVEATALPPVPQMSTSKDGELDVLVWYRPFKVTGVYKPIPEQLSDLVGAGE